MTREEYHIRPTEPQPLTQQQAIDPINDKPTTPINVERLEQELQGHPNHTFIQSLIAGLREGFHIGYKGPEKSRVSWNFKSAKDNPDVVDKFLDKETLLGRVGAPLTTLPCLTCNVTSLESFPRKTQENGEQFSTYPTRMGTRSTFTYQRMSTPCIMSLWIRL